MVRRTLRQCRYATTLEIAHGTGTRGRAFGQWRLALGCAHACVACRSLGTPVVLVYAPTTAARSGGASGCGGSRSGGPASLCRTISRLGSRGKSPARHAVIVGGWPMGRPIAASAADYDPTQRTIDSASRKYAAVATCLN